LSPKPIVLHLLVAVLHVILAAGCAETSQKGYEGTVSGDTVSSGGAAETEPARAPFGTTPSSTAQEFVPIYGYTYGQASGNRVVEGSGRVPGAEPVDVELSGEPVWVVGVPLEDDTAWIVAYGDGRVETFRLDGDTGEVDPWLTAPNQLPPGAPPAVASEGEVLRLLVVPEDSAGAASPLTHPAPFGRGLLGVTPDGRLFVKPGEVTQIPVLPDARPVESEIGSMAVLSDPMSRGIHGILGDNLEAGSITVLGPAWNSSGSNGLIRPQSGGTFEALAPLWFRPDAGEEELLAITERTERRGSRVSVYDPDATLVAAGPFLSQTWRHLLAAGPFGPDREVEIAAMLSPHSGPKVEFYALDAASGELKLEANGPGYPSHTIYSRNLDTARAGDLDGDGRWELLVPGHNYDKLVAIRHVSSGVERVWSLPLGGELATNLASTTDSEGRAQVAAGRADRVLRIWP
jgi:hypothetical protein